MPAQEIELSTSARYKYISELTHGINTSVRSDVADASELLEAVNVNFYRRSVRSETGYTPFIDQALTGTPRCVHRLVKASGVEVIICITNTRVYYKNALGTAWILAAADASTTLSGNEASGQTVLSVTSVTNFSSTDPVAVLLNDGTYHESTIASVGASDVTIDDALPSAADSGNTIWNSLLLAGADDNPVVADTIAAEDWMVFTNGVDVVLKYDGTTLEALGGLSTINVDTCITLKTFYSYLLLFGTTESGSKLPQQIRWCDTGAYEVWNSGNAGGERLLTRPDAIVGAELLGPYCIIYRENAIVRCELLAQENQLFDFNEVVSQEGLDATLALIPTKDAHYFMGTNNFYKYSGDFNITPIAEEIYFEIFGIEGGLSATYKNRSFGRYVPELNELWFFLPGSTATWCDTFYRFRLDTKAWAVRLLGEELSGFGAFEQVQSTTWNDLVGTWVQQTWKWSSQIVQANAPLSLLCGSVSNKIQAYNYLASQDNGIDIAWNLITKDFFHPFFEFVLDGIDFIAAGSSVMIEYSIDSGQSWTTINTISLIAERAKVQVNKQIATNRIRFRFSGTGPGFTLDGLGMTYSFATSTQYENIQG